MIPKSTFHALDGIPVFETVAEAYPLMPSRCNDCRRMLTPEEERHYVYRCHGCEWRWHQRMQAWRLGHDDRELDMLFLGLDSDAVKH